MNRPLSIRVTLETMELNILKAIDEHFSKDDIKAAVSAAIEAFDFDAEVRRVANEHIRNAVSMATNRILWDKGMHDRISANVDSIIADTIRPSDPPAQQEEKP